MSISRREYLESMGYTCANWTWSWSFINEKERSVIFGAWSHLEENNLQLIFSEEWRNNAHGKRSSGYNQSLRHVELIQEEYFSLYTFPMEAARGTESLVPKIRRIIPERKLKSLMPTMDGEYYAKNVSGNSADLADTQGMPVSRFTEGDKISVLQTVYERSPEARQACLDHYGSICQCCKVDFGVRYGSIGEGFIHVHHIVPVSQRPNGYTVHPTEDLVPVCPNCHAMIHKRIRPEPFSIKEIQNMLKSNQVMP